jgi:hypothetical protein
MSLLDADAPPLKTPMQPIQTGMERTWRQEEGQGRPRRAVRAGQFHINRGPHSRLTLTMKSPGN